MVKNIQETWVRSLSWEDPLEKGMTTHSSILAWRIPWTEEPGGLTVHGVAKSQIQLSDFHISIKLENTIHGRIEKSSSSNSFLCSVA